MDGDSYHVCSSTAFEPFPDAALEGSISARFAVQVARHPDCVAVVDRRRRLSYREVDAWSNGIGHAILEHARGGTEPVALVVRQGASYAAAVLGAVKSGMPYVPLDPADPPSRLNNFAASCGATMVLTDAESGDAAASIGGSARLIRIDDIAGRVDFPAIEIGPDSIAYVFFTSGSTGAPKGVYDNHRNVLHNILRYTNALHIAPRDRLSLLQGPAFSGCVSSQFGALLNGATSCPFRLAEEGPVRAAAWLRRERVTIYHSVPAVFRAVVAHGDTFPDVRVVRLEGDRATSEHVELWRRHFSAESVLANGLGTTETGLARQLIVRRQHAASRGALPVGYPVRDMNVVVVDENRRPVRQGDVGEIAVESDYLAPGYWGRPDLTEERFASQGGARVYFTGDLGRLTADGCLEYLGRRDGDLKVLGTRVAPAEVERELLRVEGVRDAAAAVREGPSGDGRLVAYVVADPGAKIDLSSVRTALADRLPAPMLPTALVTLDELPISANGKVDRRELPEPTVVGGTSATPSQSWLASVWTNVLSVDSVGEDDDFFALGGDSLAAAEIVAQIERETGRSLPLGILVRAPTVAQLSAALSEQEPYGTSSLTVLRSGNHAPPLVLLHGNTGNALHYSNLAAAIADPRPVWALEYLDPEADPRVEAIVEAHVESLRALQRGPYLLAGFCYGAVIAHELGRRLALDGHEAHVALLGITPLDLPTAVESDAYERWRRIGGPQPALLPRIRHHASVARRLERRDVPPYAARRARNAIVRTWTRVRRHRSVEPLAPARAALASHRPRPFPGRPLVVLHERDTAVYTDHAETAWMSLGTDGIDVVVLPGDGHAMLEHGGVTRLSAVLCSWLASVTADPL